MKKLVDLQKGDIIFIEYGYSIHKFKVTHNTGKGLNGLVKIGLCPFWMGISTFLYYDSYNLKKYKNLNKYIK